MHGTIGLRQTPLRNRRFLPPKAVRPEFEDAPLRRQTYVLHVYPQQEFKVFNTLRDFGFEAYVPAEPKSVRVNAIRRKTVYRPMMPGYVFAIFDEHRDNWEEIPAFDGVFRLFMVAMRPVPVPEAAVAQIREREAEYRGAKRRHKPIPFLIGSFVQIDDYGPWQGFIGQVTEHLAKKQKLVIELDIFGRRSPVEVFASQMRAI